MNTNEPDDCSTCFYQRDGDCRRYPARLMRPAQFAGVGYLPALFGFPRAVKRCGEFLQKDAAPSRMPFDSEDWRRLAEIHMQALTRIAVAMGAPARGTTSELGDDLVHGARQLRYRAERAEQGRAVLKTDAERLAKRLDELHARRDELRDEVARLSSLLKRARGVVKFASGYLVDESKLLADIDAALKGAADGTS